MRIKVVSFPAGERDVATEVIYCQGGISVCAVHVGLAAEGGGPKVTNSPLMFIRICTKHPLSLFRCSSSRGTFFGNSPGLIGVVLVMDDLVRGPHEVLIRSSRKALVLLI